MPKFDPSKPRALVTFQCRPCKKTFEAEPARVEPAPELEHHPFRYFAICRGCFDEVEQAPYERALFKAWCNATGPTSEEGKAAAAKNLEGHPTPDEALRTRFNAMKHGMNARAATYFPAKPDGYDFCKGCEVDRVWCGEQPACVKKTEIFMLHQAAFEQRDPKRLMGIYSELHAAVFAVLQQMLQTIIADGTKIVAPQWYTDKETGAMIICQYYDTSQGGDGQLKTLYELEAHPLIKPMMEMLTRVNISLSDLGMTTKVIERDGDDMGELAGKRTEREQISDYMQRQQASLESLADLVDRGRRQTESDPVLLEYNHVTGETKEVES